MTSRFTLPRYLVVSALGLAVFCSGIAGAVEVTEKTPQVRMPLMKSAPKIDGEIGEAEWAGAVRNVGFVSHGKKRVADRRGVFWVGCDGERVYIAVKSEGPPWGGNILANVFPQGDQDLLKVYKDDCLELVLDPKRGRAKEGERTFYHVTFNKNGAIFDRAVNPDRTDGAYRLSWRIKDWVFRSRVKKDWWHVEMAIPLASLGATAEDLNHPWGIRVARNWQQPSEQSQWASDVDSYMDRSSMPVVRWDASAPVVQMLSLQDEPGTANLKLSVSNPHDRPMTVRARISDAWHSDQPSVFDKELTIPAGGAEQVSLEAADHGAGHGHKAVVRVTSPDGEKTYYHRTFRWMATRPKKVWLIGKEKKREFELKFKHYPYHAKIRLRVDFRQAEFRKDVAKAVAEIKYVDRLGNVQVRSLWSEELDLAGFVSEDIYDIPDLNDGRYRLFVRLLGAGDRNVKTLTQDFQRIHYEWEHNKLGISDEVMPPFTPLEVKDSTVRCVLREHAHADGGLWGGVVTEGRPLLTAPMRWEVRAAGRDGDPADQRVESEPWKLVSAKDTEVVGESSWQAGPLRARVETTYDYDGMMLVKLALEPTGEAEVHRLSLRIPVSQAEAPLMHAVSDGLRHHYAGAVPAGEGKVWDSSQANRVELVGTFYAYLWVGGGTRGLAWFADTDKDWVLDEKTPTIELVRNGKTLEMVVHFITAPGPLDREHEIVFGLQVTPTKPMPEGWRKWIGGRDVRGGRTVHWIGMMWYWGATTFNVVPLSKRFKIYDEFERLRRGGKQDPAFLADWMKRVSYLQPVGSRYYKTVERHMRAGMGMVAAFPWSRGVRQFVYTNPRGCGKAEPEYETFLDEWTRFDWNHRDFKAGADIYDISPSESFVDYAVWYYRRMLQCFDGVYWDNIYLSANFDPVVGSAWKDEKGRMHPGLGLMHMRNLVKRTAIMHWQEAKARKLPAHRLPLIQLSHMTNTMVVPVLSFGNCNMDWEWRYDRPDFQSRVTPEMTVAQTIGRQVGAWGTILPGGHYFPKDPNTQWKRRSRLAVCLVHEIQHFDWKAPLDKVIYEKLYDWGYGEDDCKVFNYWDPPHPVSATGEGLNAKTLAMSRNGEAIVVVTDYGEGGRCKVEIDLQALGLPAEVVAVDFENGRPIESGGKGAFAFDLKKYDMKILHVKRPES